MDEGTVATLPALPKEHASSVDSVILVSKYKVKEMYIFRHQNHGLEVDLQ